MTPFDPAAATAAYLAQMSPAALARAIDYTHGKEWLLLWGGLVSLIEAWVIVRLGVLLCLREAIEKNGPRPLRASLAVGFVYLVIAWLVNIPWSIWADWGFEKAYGLTSQPLVGWFTDDLIRAGFGALVGTVFLVLLYLLLRLARRSWWLWAGVLTGCMFLVVQLIVPVTLEPMLNHYQPAPPGPVRDLVVRLGHETATPTDKIFIYNGSKQSNRYTANVAGLFGTARVAMSDVMFQKGADLAEVRGVVGHEMGHYVHQHALWGAGAVTLLAFVLFFLADRLFPVFARLLGAARVKGIADPAGAPVLFAVIGLLFLLAHPLTNTLTRMAESDADNFSLAHAHEPDGMSEALIKTADYRAPSPPLWEEVLFYDHPSVERRIRNAMQWKATHMAPTPPQGPLPPG